MFPPKWNNTYSYFLLHAVCSEVDFFICYDNDETCHFKSLVGENRFIASSNLLTEKINYVHLILQWEQYSNKYFYVESK